MNLYETYFTWFSSLVVIMESFVLFIFALVLLSYFYTTRKFQYWKRRGIPFDKPFPYVGNSLVLFKHNIPTYLKELYEKFDSPLIGIFLFGLPQLVVKDPKIIKSILMEDFSNFYDRTIVSDLDADPLSSQVLAVIKNPQWRELRQKMTPVFTTGKIKLMFPLMVEVGNDLLEYIQRNNDVPIFGKDLSTRYMTDIIASCAFGVRASSFTDDEDTDFRIISRKTFELTLLRALQMTCYFTSPFLVHLFKMKLLEPHCSELMKNLFWQVVKKRRQTRVKRNDFVDILIGIQETEGENGNLKFEGDIVAAQAIQFFIAGFETSGSTACFALFELSHHLDIQNRLRNEILAAVRKNNGVSYEAVQEMKYLDMVVHETLRKYPILPFLDRQTRNDYRIPGSDLTIEKGVAVFIPTLGLHHDPKYYPEPEKFDPERFTVENKATRPNCVFLAFGGGPRNCIGERFGLLSVKLFLIRVLMEFEVLKTQDMPSDLKFYPRGFLLSSAVSVKFLFKKISTDTSS